MIPSLCYVTKGGKGGILIEKDVYIKLYETKSITDPKNSFVWVTVSLTSCASMSIYIAMHRDIPFIEQQEVCFKLNELTEIVMQSITVFRKFPNFSIKINFFW